MFGTANVMMIVLEVEKGDIYTIETVKKIDGITRASWIPKASILFRSRH